MLGAGFALMLGVVMPPAVQGQADPDTAGLGNECRLAAQVLSTGEPAAHMKEALSTISGCGSEAVAPLLSMWNRDFPDREELVPLVMATRRLVSPPVAERLFEIMRDPSAPLDKRLACIMVMVTWADPRSWPTFDGLRDRGPDSSMLRPWSTDHAVPMSGRETLAPDFVLRLRSSLEEIAASDPSDEMKAAAAITLRNAPFW
jgi:hypothetical protein